MSSGQSPWQLFAPILVFLATNRVAGLRWAVVLATICSIAIVIDRQRKGRPLGRFFPLVTAALLLRGAVGAITGSEAVYFGLGIAAKFAGASLLAGSVVIRKPLASLGAPHILALPGETQRHPAFLTAMRDATGIAALYYFISATFDVWLFQRSDVEGYVIVRLLANWPFGLLMLGWAFAAVNARFKTIDGLDPLPLLVEQRLGSNQ